MAAAPTIPTAHLQIAHPPARSVRTAHAAPACPRSAASSSSSSSSSSSRSSNGRRIWGTGSSGTMRVQCDGTPQQPRALASSSCSRRRYPHSSYTGSSGSCRKRGAGLGRIVVVRAEAKAETATEGELAPLSREEEQDIKDIQDILETVELLKERRGMTVNEIRLTLMIEDPREAERRRQMGIEADSGCSRDEVAAAFQQVMEDSVPSDRLSLRTLAQEMRDWPKLRVDPNDVGGEGPSDTSVSPYAQVTNVGLPADSPLRRAAAARADYDWDAAAQAAEVAATTAKEQEKDLGEKLPPWVGYGFLYGLSVVPFIIVALVVIILFLNSLQ